MVKIEGVKPVVFSLEHVSDGEILFCFIADDNNPHAFDWEDFKNRGICPKRCSTYKMEEVLDRCENLRITRDFWTCSCDKDFIHHHKEFICTKCLTIKHNSTARLKKMEDSLGWVLH